MSRDRAFRVVADFEAALCEFTGAPHAVTVDSCTNAIFLALKYIDESYSRVRLPKHTYVGVVQAARNAGYEVDWTNQRWRGFYRLAPTFVFDCAKHFERGMYQAGTDMCVSFQAGKLLPVGRGGAILTDDEYAAEWYRWARLDGRKAGADYSEGRFAREGFHMYMTPPDAARGLWLMTYLEDDDKGDWREYPDLSEAAWL